MRSGRSVTIIGAGISGLLTAYAFRKQGYPVTVLEQSSRVGGLIQTEVQPWGVFETAANGFLNSAELEDLAACTGIRLLPARRASKKRYIYHHGKARRWPLSFRESVQFLPRLLGIKKNAPRPYESIAEWSVRALGEAPFRHLVSPALQGIYAGDPCQLSAQLILGKYFKKKRTQQKKPAVLGTVAPLGGMSEFTNRLKEWLEAENVEFKFNHPVVSVREIQTPVVITVPPTSASQMLQSTSPVASTLLSEVEFSSVCSVSMAFEKKQRVQAPFCTGFGCLFERNQGVRALGVLFEDQIFGNRSAHHLERWIVGGALDSKMIELSDSDLIRMLMKDRETLYGEIEEPIGVHVSRYLEGIPHYTVQLEKILNHSVWTELAAQKILISSNYFGTLGVSRILERALELPQIWEQK